MMNERARFRLHHPASGFDRLEEQVAGSPDEVLAQRVIAAFSKGPNSVRAGPIWQELLKTKQDRLITWLCEGNAAALATDLAALGRSEAAQGFFGGAEQHRKHDSDPDFARLLGAWTYDKLLSLAEALGAVPLELPENGAWGENIRISPDTLMESIEDKLGIDLTPPDHVGSYLGIPAGRYLIQMRIIEAIYAAWRLKSLADRYELKTVCEIGAGAGFTAYYASLMGIEDYIVIDLPSMNAVQGYLLGGSRVGESVTLHGEPVHAGTSIRLLPPNAFAELPMDSVGILYNQDSFPEIEQSAAKGYLADAERLAVPLLLSINQEAQLPTSDGHQMSVPELMTSVSGYRLFSRHRHWLRQGYVEELYELLRR